MIGRDRLSVVCETRSGKCSIDDDEDRSNQMTVIEKRKTHAHKIDRMN